jgi:hypothetical protein
MLIGRACLTTLAAAVLALVAGGCDHSKALRASHGRVDVHITEFHLTPSRVYATPGVLRIVLHNDGRLPQNLAVSQGGIILAQTTTIKPGQTAVTTFRFLPPGLYRLSSSLSDYDVLGEYGFMVVR